jgi:hypothetical protein
MVVSWIDALAGGAICLGDLGMNDVVETRLTTSVQFILPL